MVRKMTCVSSQLTSCLVAVIGTPLLVTTGVLAQSSRDLRITVSESPLYKKVIVYGSGAALHDQPGARGEPIPPLMVFHQLQTDDGKEEFNGFIRVGDADGKPLGWIKKDNLISWNTRFVLDPHLPEKDAVFTVFADAQLKRVFAEYTGSKAGYRTLALILDKPTDKHKPVFNVAFFRVRPRIATGGSRQTLELTDLRLEVMFVVETNAGMAASLEAIQEVARQLADALTIKLRLKGAVRLGVVQYQDATKGLTPVNLVSKLTGDLDDFMKAIGRLKTAKALSEDKKSDVLAGLKLAIDEAGWSRISSKHIILWGASGARMEGRKNTTGLDIRQVIDLGRRPSREDLHRQLGAINFHAVRVDTPDEVDRKVAAAQFQQIAGNNGGYEGMYREIRDLESEAARREVVTMLVKQLTHADDALARARDTADTAIDPVFYKITNVTRAEEAQVLNTGWARTHTPQRRRTATIKVMVSEDELVRYANVLDFLYKRLSRMVEPDRRGDSAALLLALQEPTVRLVSGQRVPRGKVHDMIAALPAEPDILCLSAEEIAGFNKEEFRAWLGQLKRTLDHVETIKAKSDWIEVTGGKIRERYTFLRLSDLP